MFLAQVKKVFGLFELLKQFETSVIWHADGFLPSFTCQISTLMDTSPLLVVQSSIA